MRKRRGGALIAAAMAISIAISLGGIPLLYAQTTDATSTATTSTDQTATSTTSTTNGTASSTGDTATSTGTVATSTSTTTPPEATTTPPTATTTPPTATTTPPTATTTPPTATTTPPTGPLMQSTKDHPCNDMDGDEDASSTLPFCPPVQTGTTSPPGVPNTGGGVNVNNNNSNTNNNTNTNTNNNSIVTVSSNAATTGTTNGTGSNSSSNSTSNSNSSSNSSNSSTNNAPVQPAVSGTETTAASSTAASTTMATSTEPVIVPFISFRWMTSMPGTSEIFYSTGASSTLSSTPAAMDTSLTTDHFLLLTNLETDTTYFITVRSRDNSGNVLKEENMTIIPRKVDVTASSTVQ